MRINVIVNTIDVIFHLSIEEKNIWWRNKKLYVNNVNICIIKLLFKVSE